MVLAQMQAGRLLSFKESIALKLRETMDVPWFRFILDGLEQKKSCRNKLSRTQKRQENPCISCLLRFGRILTFNAYSFLGGGAKRPACRWQERLLGRRELNKSTETSGGSGSEPPRRLRLRKGEPFLGYCKERFPRQSFVSFFHSRFWLFEDCLPSMIDIDARPPYKSSVSKLRTLRR
ncbi:MAG: hypothetical protein MR400_05415 [Clostridiales bacterium]|nr:hypothetical protein [Clostridiales bacterium]